MKIITDSNEVTELTHLFAVNLPGDYCVFLHRTLEDASAEVDGNAEYGSAQVSPSEEWIGSRTARFFALADGKMVQVELVCSGETTIPT